MKPEILTLGINRVYLLHGKLMNLTVLIDLEWKIILPPRSITKCFYKVDSFSPPVFIIKHSSLAFVYCVLGESSFSISYVFSSSIWPEASCRRTRKWGPGANKWFTFRGHRFQASIFFRVPVVGLLSGVYGERDRLFTLVDETSCSLTGGRDISTSNAVSSGFVGAVLHVHKSCLVLSTKSHTLTLACFFSSFILFSHYVSTKARLSTLKVFWSACQALVK